MTFRDDLLATANLFPPRHITIKGTCK